MKRRGSGWASIGAERVLFLFLDGVGLGAADKGNPFALARTPFLEGLLGDKLTLERTPFTQDGLVFGHLDASLGVPGLPQSATGQTALLTGENAAALMGRHYGPWPGPTLLRRLDEGTLFSEVKAAGGRALLANLYPPEYFAAIERGKRRPNVPVYAAQRAGLEFLTPQDYTAGRALSADLTGAYLHARDKSYPLKTPQQAGRDLARIAASAQFTFFDFWLSDEAGHRWALEDAVGLVEMLDGFLEGLIPALEDTLLLLTSDHGNLEDKHVTTHTLNPVPLLVLGASAARFAEVRSLMGLAPSLRRLWL